MHRLLSALLSVELSAAAKFKIMETEYHIEIDDQIGEDVSEMCNLGQGVFEAGEARGETRIILSMYKSGLALDQIAGITEKTVEEIKTIIENAGSILV